MAIKARNIKPFTIDGEARDQEDILRLRPQLESHLIDDMRVKGYVPVIDITYELFWEYVPDTETFKYAVIIYGTYVGKKKAQEVLGMLGPHEIMIEPYKKKVIEEDES